MIRRWRMHLNMTKRQRLADDARRAVGAMRMVAMDAGRTDAVVPDSIPASIVVWVVWSDYLDEWAER